MPGWKDLIICGVDEPAQYAHDCGFSDLVLLANNFITDLIILSTLIAVAVFIFAGFKLLMSGGNEKAKDEAKKMFWSVIKGYIVILVAWLLIYTITSALLKEEYTFLLRQ